MVAGIFKCKFNHFQTLESLLHVSDYEVFLTNSKYIYCIIFLVVFHTLKIYIIFFYFLLSFSILHGIYVFVYDTSLDHFLGSPFLTNADQSATRALWKFIVIWHFLS